jgi:hypothetical protein
MIPDHVPEMLWDVNGHKVFLAVWIALHFKQG